METPPSALSAVGQPADLALLARAMELLPTGFAMTDLSGAYLQVNPAFCRLVGRTEKEILGHRIEEFSHPQDFLRQRHFLESMLEGRRETFQMEKRYVRPDGSEVWAFMHTAILRDDEGRPFRLACQVQDISDRVASERALAKSLDRFSSLLASLDQGVMEIDTAGEILYGNAAAARILGVPEEIIGTRSIWSDEWHVVDLEMNPLPKEKLPLAQVLRTERMVRGARMGLIRPNGELVWMMVNAEPLVDFEGRLSGAVATFLDETEVLKREKALFQSQKLESLGLLAGGIAHDFNNLLGAMLMNLGMARTLVEPETNLARHVEVAEGLAEKSADLTRQLLAYAGRSKPKSEPVAIGQLVADMGRLLRASLPKTLEFSMQLEKDLPAIRGDRAQLQQVILNLITNAADAMGDRHGHLWLRARCLDPSVEAVPASVKSLAPTLVEVSVEDQGCGMDEVTLSRIFDPFFTTKAKGRGLGLAALQGIVRAHGGAVTVESQKDVGTTFRLWFPALEVAAGGSDQPEEKAPFRGEGLVLVVDDEDAVREVATELLRSLGFQVLEARDGIEAMDLFKSNADSLRLVVLDMAMPRLGGLETYQSMREIQPEICVLLSSGFAPKPVELKWVEEGKVDFLPKPYRIQDLVSKVQIMLQGDPKTPD
jgi:two-component system cell cycle sensor histidine kinase/response regulator CckA